jgi:hypothetical protein
VTSKSGSDKGPLRSNASFLRVHLTRLLTHAWNHHPYNLALCGSLVRVAGTSEEKALVAPDEFESPFEATSFINLLGNCSLLDKSFNISKSDAPMWEFLEDVHEFKEGKIQRTIWESALSLTSDLTKPEGYSLGNLRKSLLVRDATIRKDLVEFIAGTRATVDA